MSPAVVKVVKAFRTVTESKRGRGDVVVGNVLGPFLGSFGVEMMPGNRTGPLDTARGQAPAFTLQA